MSDIHKHFDQLSENQQRIVGDAYEMVASYLKENNIKTNGFDPAERLVDAIAKYILECKKL